MARMDPWRRRGLRVTLGGSLRRTVAGVRTFKCVIKGLLHTLPKMLGQDFLHIVSSRVHYGIVFEAVRPVPDRQSPFQIRRPRPGLW